MRAPPGTHHARHIEIGRMVSGDRKNGLVRSVWPVHNAAMTITRRDAIASFALLADLLAADAHAGAQTPPSSAPPAAPRPPIFTQDLPNVTLDDWEVTVSHVDYPPGRVGSGPSPRRVRARVCPRGLSRHEDLGPGRGEDLHRRADVLRAARRDSRGLQEREPDAARETARDDLRQEGIGPHDARSGTRARWSSRAGVAPKQRR